jgi:hypothetical protein
VLPPAQGGRKPSVPLTVEVVRELTPDDLPALEGATPSSGQRLLQIRNSHHALARLLAQGTKQEEASLITGYSPAYISTLKNDPAFEELLSYYATQREQIFVDVLERMKSLGLSTLEELQHRLETEPEKWQRRELMELAELMVVKPMAAKLGAQGPGGGNGVTVNVSFVATKAKPVTEGGVDFQELRDITPEAEDDE